MEWQPSGADLRDVRRDYGLESSVEFIDILRLHHILGVPDQAVHSAGLPTEHKGSIPELLAMVTDAVGIAGDWQYTLRPIYLNRYCLKTAGGPFVDIHIHDTDDPFDSSIVRNGHIGIYGEPAVVKCVYEALSGLKKAAGGTVSWYFRRSTDNAIRAHHIVLKDVPKAQDCYYPDLPGGVEAYLTRYLESSASILFMTGDPGTGKSSLIRYMIASRGLHGTITYDEQSLSQDEMFVQFMVSQAPGVLVVEDADTMLMSRESSANAMMARFLNVSDGLIKMQNKKIIFTNNLPVTRLRDVDSALTRPGRCFDAVHLRPLKWTEAAIAAETAGLPVPYVVRDYTLAEIFNQPAAVQ